MRNTSSFINVVLKLKTGALSFELYMTGSALRYIASCTDNRLQSGFTSVQCGVFFMVILVQFTHSIQKCVLIFYSGE